MFDYFTGLVVFITIEWSSIWIIVCIFDIYILRFFLQPNTFQMILQFDSIHEPRHNNLFNWYVPFEERSIISNYIIANSFCGFVCMQMGNNITLVQYQERGWYNQTMSNKRATQRRERARNLERQVSQQIFLHISWEHLRLLLNVAKCEKGKLHHERKSTRAAHKS